MIGANLGGQQIEADRTEWQQSPGLGLSSVWHPSHS
jgi:hypothetical protein